MSDQLYLNKLGKPSLEEFKMKFGCILSSGFGEEVVQRFSVRNSIFSNGGYI